MLRILNETDSVRRIGVLRDDRSIDHEREMFRTTLERNGFSRVLCRYRVPHAVEAHQSVRISYARSLKNQIGLAPVFRTVN